MKILFIIYKVSGESNVRGGGAMTIKNLEALRGDDVFYRLFFTDSDNNPIDITGWKIYFTAKISNEDSDDNAVIKVDTTDLEDPHKWYSCSSFNYRRYICSS